MSKWTSSPWKIKRGLAISKLEVVEIGVKNGRNKLNVKMDVKNWAQKVSVNMGCVRLCVRLS